MNPADYFSDAGWSDLVPDRIGGRPMLLWRKRPRHMLDLLDLACRRSDLDYLVQDERRFSFADFHRAVEAGAAELDRLGVGRGDRVIIALHNCCEVPLLQWALLRIGAIPVFGNRWWTARELADVLDEVEPKLLVSDLELEDRSVARFDPAGLASWWLLPPPTKRAPDPRSASSENDVALVAFTAGSTGGPKGVELLHRNLIWTVQTLHVMQRGRPPFPADAATQKVALITTPMFHNGAIVTGILSLVDGARMVTPRGKFVAEEALDLIEGERVTSWMAVPTMFRRLMRDPTFAGRDLSSLTAPSTGGTMVPPELIEDVASCLPAAADTMAVAYGMTEMSFISMATAPQLRERPGTVGRLVLGIEARIDSPDEHGEGEILARSGALMKGYLGDGEQPIDADGWYHSGDLGRFDEDGFLYVTGRTKDMVIRGGENISCPHVEQVLATHPDILEVAVTGCRDEDLGEALVAILHLRGGAQADPRDLEAFARARLAYFAVPSRWIFREEPLPVLPTGKIDKRRLAREIGQAAAPAPVS